MQKAAADRCPGIVHQHANARIFAQALLDPGEIPRVRQIGRHHIHCDAGFTPEALGQCGQPRRIAGNQDEILTAARKSIRIDRPDASRRARYEDSRFRIHGELLLYAVMLPTKVNAC
jgi:hypothetical protein